MENQISMNYDDRFIDSLEYYDFDIDYGFLNEILNSETVQENNSQTYHDQEYKFDSSSYFDITELDVINNNVDEQRVINVDDGQNNNNNNNNREGWVRRRKFKKGTVEHALWKQEMKLKNRISARRSIEKKEAYIRELEGKIQRLQAENEFRGRVLEIFPNSSKPAGRLCGLRRAFSTSDFYLTNQVAVEEEIGMCF